MCVCFVFSPSQGSPQDRNVDDFKKQEQKRFQTTKIPCATDHVTSAASDSPAVNEKDYLEVQIGFRWERVITFFSLVNLHNGALESICSV
jgi:hypothetical protein